MSHYRRSLAVGATFFFTLTLADRTSSLLTSEIERLRNAYRNVHANYPFETVAICVLPDHLHAIWRLPEGDGAFGLRWSLIKRSFSTGLPASEQRSDSKRAKREKGLWQRRFWEHEIRDDLDLQRHVDNVHYNPVKHGLVRQAKDWPHSSFHRHVEMGLLAVNWGGGDIGIASQYGE